MAITMDDTNNMDNKQDGVGGAYEDNKEDGVATNDYDEAGLDREYDMPVDLGRIKAGNSPVGNPSTGLKGGLGDPRLA